jgi:hypothetical protein
MVEDKDNQQERALLTQLLHESKLYRTGKDFKELLDFVNRLPNFAPFNASLLQIQKPGLRFAAFESDWKTKFKRTIKEGARPLIILWAFGPVALVYDIDDTEGDELPSDVAHAFKAKGNMTEKDITRFISLLEKKGIYVKKIEYGDAHAGHIQRPEHDYTIENQSKDAKIKPNYQIRLNKKHDANVQFATLIHELGHLFLGHLGEDKFLKISARNKIHEVKEIEAESVCYIVCNRNGVKPDSESYLSNFVTHSTSTEFIDLYELLKVAGNIEAMLGLSIKTSFKNSLQYELIQ